MVRVPLSDEQGEALEERELPSKARGHKAQPSPKKQSPNRGNSKTITLKGELTLSQDKFARAVALGTSLVEAYRLSYNVKTTNIDNMYVAACKLSKHPKISTRIQRLKEALGRVELQDAASLRKVAVKRLVTEAEGLGPDTASNSRIAAAVAIGKMTDVDLFTDHKVIEHVDHRKIDDLKTKLEQRLTALFDRAQSSPNTALTRQPELLPALPAPKKASPGE